MNKRIPREGVLILLVALIFSIRMADPFIYPHDANNAIFGVAARNHLRHGLGETFGAHLLVPMGHEITRTDYYLNHPGTISLIAALSHAVIGSTEFATRIVPALFSLWAIVIFHRACRNRWGARVGLYSALALALFPGFGYYGKMLNFEPIALPLGILFLDSLERSIAAGRRVLFPALPTALAFALGMIDYGGFFAALAAAVAFRFRRESVGPLIFATGACLIQLFVVLAIGGRSGLLALFAARSARAAVETSFTEIVFTQIQYLRLNLTPIGLVAASAGAVIFAMRIRRHGAFLCSFALWGLLNIAFFPQAARIHDYWGYYLLPGAAILAGFALRGPESTRRLWMFAATGTLVALLAWDLLYLHARFYRDSGWYRREFAAISFARANPGTGPILTRWPVRSLHPVFYADRRFVHEPALTEDFAVAAR